MTDEIREVGNSDLEAPADISEVDFDAIAKNLEGLNEVCERTTKRDRAIYLDNPDRKFFCQIDLAELLWWHAFDQHRMVLNDIGIEEIVDAFFENYKYQELIYEIIEEYKEEHPERFIKKNATE